MKKRMSSVLVFVMVLNLVAAFAAFLPAATVMAGQTSRTVLEENFSSYADIAAMQEAGWSVTGTVSLATSTLQNNLQYFRTSASANAYKTFEPVPLRAAGGESPGINARLIVIHDLSMSSGSGSSSAFARVDDTTTGNVAVSAGRRAGSGSYIRYAKTIGSSFTGLTISSSAAQFQKIKYVIKITDENGQFLSTGPKVDVYCNDMETPLTDGVDRNMIDSATTSVNRFYMGGAFNVDVDNIDIQLVTDSEDSEATPEPTEEPTAEPTSTPEPTPTPTPEPILGRIETSLLNDTFDTYADINEAATAGWAMSGMSETSTPIPVLATTANPEYAQYLRVNGASASKTFDPVPVQASGGASPGKNARIVLEYDGYMSGGSGGSSSFFRLDQSEPIIIGAATTVPSAVSVGRRAVRSSRLDYATSIGSTASSYIVSNSISKFMRIKSEVKITDSYGNFLTDGPRVSIWVNGELVLANMAMNITQTSYVDKFTISSASGVNSEIDNLSIKLITDDTYITQQKTVNVSIDDGLIGTVNPVGTLIVDEHDGRTLRITPTQSTGMKIDYVKINGVAVDPEKIINYAGDNFQYTVPAVTEDILVNVRFAQVDKSVLDATLSEATILYQTAQANIGTEPGQYLEANVTALSNQIASAQSVFVNIAATQNAVDTAVANLQAKIDACKQIVAYTVTVSIDNTKGMVINRATGLAVMNGQTVTLTEGTSAQFKVVAYGGYKIDGVVYGSGAPAGTGMFIYSLNTGVVEEDANLVVTFSDYSPGTPMVDSYNEVFVSTEDSQPIAVSYGTVHGQLDDGACGIILWNTGDSDVTLELALADPADAIHVFSATSASSSKGLNSLGQFGIKVKNLPNGAYKMKTYVVQGGNVRYGDIITFTIA